MYLLDLEFLLRLHDSIIAESGGSHGIRDLGGIESALAQQHLTFGEADIYPDLISKSAAVCFSLVMNHGFIDGNKRIGHAALENLLVINGYQIKATVDEQEDLILRLADGKVSREELHDWLKDHVVKLNTESNS